MCQRVYRHLWQFEDTKQEAKTLDTDKYSDIQKPAEARGIIGSERKKKPAWLSVCKRTTPTE
jgi:hypothetical protein